MVKNSQNLIQHKRKPDLIQCWSCDLGHMTLRSKAKILWWTVKGYIPLTQWKVTRLWVKYSLHSIGNSSTSHFPLRKPWKRGNCLEITSDGFYHGSLTNQRKSKLVPRMDGLMLMVLLHNKNKKSNDAIFLK